LTAKLFIVNTKDMVNNSIFFLITAKGFKNLQMFKNNILRI